MSLSFLEWLNVVNDRVAVDSSQIIDMNQVVSSHPTQTDPNDGINQYVIYHSITGVVDVGRYLLFFLSQRV